MPTSNDALESLSVNTIRTLAMDAVERAGSGHPGAPMGQAPLAYALWTRILKYDASDPAWPDRDRFVLSCGHASMLLYAALFLTGHGLELDDLRAFRQWGSCTAGHPEHELPGVEMTTGPLGQGFATAVGMALGERLLAARFNRDGHEVVDHRTWVLASDGDLMEGVSYEAASLAGHWGLSKLCVFYDDNRITIDGRVEASMSEDVGVRFEALGWHVLRVGLDGRCEDYVRAAEAARAETARPTLVMFRSHIGFGAPTKQDSPSAHGAPLGEAELRGAKANLGWDHEEAFFVPPEVLEHMREAGRRGGEARRAWASRMESYAREHPDLAASFEAARAGRTDAARLDRAMPVFEVGAQKATRQSSGRVLNALKDAVPELVGGSADLAGSNKTTLADEPFLGREGGAARNLHFGIREHAMGAVANGLALHGGFRPYVGTFLVFSDYMRPAIRLAALMRLPVTYVFTHDSIGVGEDGPTHQPVEHLAALRAMPGLRVVRPADGAETAEAWRLALTAEGPTALALSRQGLVEQDHAKAPAEGLRRGAYVLNPEVEDPEVCLIATGSEVMLAMEAARVLGAEGLEARVVSMPCWEAFEQAPPAWREEVLGGDVPRVAIEAAASFGWERWTGRHGAVVALDRFGASAPGPVLMEELGFTVDRVAAVAKETLAAVRRELA
jgi:transketolase